MKLPVMNVIKRSMQKITAFVGLDQRPKPADAAFADMRNTTCERLPLMAARKPRERVRTLRRPGGLFAHDRLCWVDGTDFYYDGEVVGQVTEGEKQFVRMGAQVLIWPDAACYNTATGTFGMLGASFTTYSDAEVTCALCKLDGTPYEDYEVGSTAPQNPENGQLWLDTSAETNVLRYYSKTAAMWQSVPTVYTKITSPGIGEKFRKNDGVEIHGMTLEMLNGSFALVDTGTDWVIVIALITQPHTQQERVTISRTIPEMDFVCENDNRIWGCSNKTHEIFASVLGDAGNWKRYLGLDSDSYAVTVGTAGDFTGCAAHAGHVLFFKENTIHQIMGTAPRNFTLSDSMARGVARGSEKSLAHANEYLLYKSPMDVCMMGMSTLPSTVSARLGKAEYSNCTAGTLGSRYFLNAACEDGSRLMLVYDTESAAWCVEDDIHVTHFATLDSVLYMLTAEGEIWCVGEAEEKLKDETTGPESVVRWEMTTGPIGLDEPYSKYISAIQLHVGCTLGSMLKAEVRYDGEGIWHRVFRLDPVQVRSMVIPIIPRRCRTMEIRLHGEGAFELYSITKAIEQGSDVYAHH